MKKYFFLFLAIQLSINCFSQTPTAGQLKITIESFKCINQSWDGLVEFDGHGNEVFIDYGYRIYNPSTPGSSKAGAAFTPVFGSAVNGQIKAGNQSAIGGIANGNEVMMNIVALNEHVDADNIILFSPSVWEWDNSNNDKLNLFNRQLATDLNWVMAQPYPFLNAAIKYDDPFLGRFIKIGDKYSSYWPILKYNEILKPLFNVQNNRPVGAQSGPFNGELLALYNPALLLLDTKTLSAFYSYNKRLSEIDHAEKGSYITGITEMTFTENTYAIVTSNGSYSLKLKIEFTPDNPSAASTSDLTGTPTKNTAKKTFGNRSISILNTALYLPGTWTGTYGYGESNTPNNYGMTFNADGTMQVIDQFGVVQARGTYIFTQASRNITAAYTYLVGDAFDFNGTMTDNVISGQWWRRNDKNHGGKMILYKK